jgi:polar amino acid transport system substrate-binding protein
VEKAGEVIDHIREFSSGRAAEAVETLALREAVERACEFFRAELSSNDIDLLIQIPDRLTVRLNRNRFEQVIINLVANAKDNLLAKHMDTQGPRDHILLQGRSSGNGLLLDVIDSGTGIPDSAQQSLFDPFVTSKQESGGSGLGLFICQRLMQDMGGGIELLTTSVKGTTFRLHLPR